MSAWWLSFSAELAARWMPHLMLMPIVVPLLAACLMLLLREERQRTKVAINLVATLVGLGVSLLLLVHAAQPGSGLSVYLAGNWQAPFGIVLVLDRLSALMLVLTSTVALLAAPLFVVGLA